MGLQDGQEPAFNGSNADNASPIGLDDEALIGDEIVAIDGEARIRDLTLGRDLEFERPRAIRPLIERHRLALEALGPLATRCGKSRGQEFTEYLLNRNQSIFVAAKSETPKATELVIGVIKRLDAYERGVVAPALPRELTLAERRLRVMERISAIRMVDQIRKTKGPQAAADSLPGIYADVGVRVSLTRPQAQQEMDLPPGPCAPRRS